MGREEEKGEGRGAKDREGERKGETGGEGKGRELPPIYLTSRIGRD